MTGYSDYERLVRASREIAWHSSPPAPVSLIEHGSFMGMTRHVVVLDAQLVENLRNALRAMGAIDTGLVG